MSISPVLSTAQQYQCSTVFMSEVTRAYNRFVSVSWFNSPLPPVELAQGSSNDEILVNHEGTVTL